MCAFVVRARAWSIGLANMPVHCCARLNAVSLDYVLKAHISASSFVPLGIQMSAACAIVGMHGVDTDVFLCQSMWHMPQCPKVACAVTR